MNNIISICLLSLILISCSQQVKSVGYYQANPDEAKQMVSTCPINTSNDDVKTQNCKNAQQAIAKIDAKNTIKPIL